MKDNASYKHSKNNLQSNQSQKPRFLSRNQSPEKRFVMQRSQIVFQKPQTGGIELFVLAKIKYNWRNLLFICELKQTFCRFLL